MSVAAGSRRFEYRKPRISTGFHIDFVAGGETAHGLCRDVSNEGIRAEFDNSVMVHSEGLLILHAPIGTLRLNALVAYIDRQAVGFVFDFATPWERIVTTQFIATIADSQGPSLVVKLP